MTVSAVCEAIVTKTGCDDSTPVRGASYEPAVLSGVSAEPRLSRDLFLFSWGAFFGRVEAIAVKATNTSEAQPQPQLQLKHDTPSLLLPSLRIRILR
jgi:hypothetical protein